MTKTLYNVAIFETNIYFKYVYCISGIWANMNVGVIHVYTCYILTLHRVYADIYHFLYGS